MNNPSIRRRILCPWTLLIAGVVGFSSFSARAQDRPATTQRLGQDRVVQIAMVNNPTLQSAVLETKRADEAVRFEGGRYPYILQLDGGLTRTASPRGTDEGVSVSKSDSIDVGAQVSRTFPLGTRATLRVDGYRDLTRQPSRSGPNYGSSARASITQPLMRGFGMEVGEQQLRVAKIQRSVAELSRDRVASEVARDVLLAYWELWYSESAMGIEDDARDLAKRQRDEAQQRVDDGALAPVEVLPFETRVASLEESVVSAETERRKRSLALAQRLGSDDDFGTNLFAEIEQDPVPLPMPPRSAAIEQALAQSPEMRELEGQLRLAREQLRTSGDSYRARLDLEGYVQVAGLGQQEVPPALEQMVKGQATSAHLGLVYELPLDDARRSSERSRDVLAVRVAEQKLQAARQRIQAEVETLLEQEQAARIRLELAEKTAAIAAKQVAAATERFELGVAISVEVQQAEDELRRAQLRAVRAQVDVVEAGVQREHATGQLLAQVGDLLRRSPTEAGK